MKLILLVFLCAFTVSAYGQFEQRSTLGMSGSSSMITVGDKTLYVSASVGQQSVIGTIGNEAYTMRQGFQQPPVRVAALPVFGSLLDAVVYPNPVFSIVTVIFGSPVKSDIISAIYDIQGRAIITMTTAPEQSFEMDLSKLASGSYILKIAVGNDIFSTRLIKN